MKPPSLTLPPSIIQASPGPGAGGRRLCPYLRRAAPRSPLGCRDGSSARSGTGDHAEYRSVADGAVERRDGTEVNMIRRGLTPFGKAKSRPGYRAAAFTSQRDHPRGDESRACHQLRRELRDPPPPWFSALKAASISPETETLQPAPGCEAWSDQLAPPATAGRPRYMPSGKQETAVQDRTLASAGANERTRLT